MFILSSRLHEAFSDAIYPLISLTVWKASRGFALNLCDNDHCKFEQPGKFEKASNWIRIQAEFKAIEQLAKLFNHIFGTRVTLYLVKVVFLYPTTFLGISDLPKLAFVAVYGVP